MSKSAKTRSRTGGDTRQAVRHLIKVNKGLIYAIQSLRADIQSIREEITFNPPRASFPIIPTHDGWRREPS